MHGNLNCQEDDLGLVAYPGLSLEVPSLEVPLSKSDNLLSKDNS